MKEVLDSPETTGMRPHRPDQPARPGINAFNRCGFTRRFSNKLGCKPCVGRRIICVKRGDGACPNLTTLMNCSHQGDPNCPFASLPDQLSPLPLVDHGGGCL